jgi:hypothetical protein
LGIAKANATSGPKLENAFVLRLQTHARTQNGTIDLRVKVVRIRVGGDELGNLDASDEILVGLRHEVVVS